MSKKALTTIGILAMVGVVGYAAYIIYQRYRRGESLLPGSGNAATVPIGDPITFLKRRVAVCDKLPVEQHAACIRKAHIDLERRV